MTRELGRLAVTIAGAPVMFVGAVRERLGGRGLRKGDVKVRGLRDLAELCDLHLDERLAELERRLE